MHASILQLLTLRDDEPVPAGITEHIEACALCTAEVTRLVILRDRMRAMGSPVPVGDSEADKLWSRIQPALVSPRPRPSSANWYLAIAAAFVWMVVALVWLVVAGHESAGTLRTVSTPVPIQAALDALLVESQDLESMLLELPQRPQVEQAATAATLDALEGQIQWLDYTLSRSEAEGIPEEQAALLWKQRVDLLESLVALRFAQASRYYF